VGHHQTCQHTHKGSRWRRGDNVVERIFEELMAENFLICWKSGLQIQAVQATSIETNARRFTPTHTIIKLVKAKDKQIILKNIQENCLVTCKRSSVRLTAKSKRLLTTIFISNYPPKM
jgi:hypothetical protein